MKIIRQTNISMRIVIFFKDNQADLIEVTGYDYILWENSFEQHTKNNAARKITIKESINGNGVISLRLNNDSTLFDLKDKKETPKVDLTAMVDLAFLSITFFMLTTSLTKQNAMDIVKPDETDDFARIELPASRTMTILLGKKNKVAWYMGETGKSRPYVEDYKQIRRSILNNKMKLASDNSNPKKSLLVVIKPTSGATYKNFVDIMDELNITKITSAPSVDDDHITETEKAFMKEEKIL